MNTKTIDPIWEELSATQARTIATQERTIASLEETVRIKDESIANLMAAVEMLRLAKGAAP